jgi:hypothetical protein
MMAESGHDTHNKWRGALGWQAAVPGWAAQPPQLQPCLSPRSTGKIVLVALAILSQGQWIGVIAATASLLRTNPEPLRGLSDALRHGKGGSGLVEDATWSARCSLRIRHESLSDQVPIAVGAATSQFWVQTRWLTILISSDVTSSVPGSAQG